MMNANPKYSMIPRVRVWGGGGSGGRFFTKGAAFGIFFALGRAIFRTGRDFAG